MSVCQHSTIIWKVKMSIIKVENLTYKYNAGTSNEVLALNDVSFNVKDGEFLGIIGKTGSGKSTLVKHLNGLLKPHSGKVFIDKNDIWKNKKSLKKARFDIGLCFQYPEYQLFAQTVLEDIAFGPINMGKSDKEAIDLAKSSANIMKIDDNILEKSPFELSGGQKRRVAIAGIIAMNPKVLVLDEPFASLDPESVQELSNLLKDYIKTKNKTIIVVSHDMTQMANLCNNIIVLNDGKLVMNNTPDKIFEDVELLTRYDLDIPEITQVFLKLKNKGLDLNTKVYTVEQGKQAVLDYISRCENA